MSVFYDHMNEIIKFYEPLEAGEVTHGDFIRLQKFEKKINDARNIGYYNELQYKSIVNAWLDLMDGYCAAIARIDPTYAEANGRDKTTGEYKHV